MVEIGVATLFAYRNIITAFAGVEPGANLSGTCEVEIVRTSKNGPPELYHALFLIIDHLPETITQDDPVCRFIDKERVEGKPYLVYMTAVTNKFLRIYHKRVKEYLLL